MDVADNPALDPTMPTVNRSVIYQTDGRGGLRYALPAVVVRTRRSTDPRAIEQGHVAELADGFTVDLFVMSLEGEHYGESAVPYDADGSPRSWRWHIDGSAETTAGPE